MWIYQKKSDLYLTASRPNAVWPFRKVKERIDSALDDNISSDTNGY